MFAVTLDRIVHAAPFQALILGLILLAAVVVGLETSPALMADYGRFLHGLDRLIVWAFALEACLKIGAHGRRPWRYFGDPWNVFDFTVVVLCFIPATGQFAAIARLARVLRTLRLATMLPRLQLIVASLLKGLPSMGYVGLLLLMLFYVYGVMGVFLFRGNDPFHFGDLGRSLLTLFGVVTLDSWGTVFYPQFYGSDVHPVLAEPAVGPVPQAMPVAAVAYFLSFILLGTIIMLNLVIGVILSSMQEAQTERDRATLAAAREGDGGLSSEQEIELIEHQIEAIRRQLHGVRAGLKAGRKVAPQAERPISE